MTLKLLGTVLFIAAFVVGLRGWSLALAIVGILTLAAGVAREEGWRM